MNRHKRDSTMEAESLLEALHAAQAHAVARPPATTSEERFRRFSQASAEIVGRSRTFFIAMMVVVVWAVSGPFFHFSDTWQLVINTGTTVVTFLMVFLIQNTQNRDAHAIHLKLDELIRANVHARNGLLALELRSDEEMQRLQAEFERLHDHVQEVRESHVPSDSDVSVRAPAAARGAHDERSRS